MSQKARIILVLATAVTVGTAQAFGWSEADRSHPPTEAEARELLKAICPRGIQIHHFAEYLTFPACHPCPTFTSRSYSLAGKRDFFDLEVVINGSYTKPGEREAVGGFNGCEDHTTTPNFRSSVLFRKGEDGWRMVDDFRFETSKCQDYRLPSGRDILLCRGFSGHADRSDSWVFAYDFADPEGRNERVLFNAINTWGACGPTAIVGSIENVELRDLDHDGMPDVSIIAKVIEEKASGPRGVCGEDFSSLPGKKYQIDFLFREGKFVVAPWSAAAKERLEDIFKAAQ